MFKTSGLIYIKHGRVGTRSEGPDYFLQSFERDYLLRFRERTPWQPDFELEFYNRAMVEVEGELRDDTLKVASIREILSPMIPSAAQK